MSPFAPLGEKARWKVLYALLRAKAVGEVVTYREMADALELDERADRHVIQIAFRRAAQEFEEQDRHAVECVRGTGYRVVDTMDHLRLARQHGRKAGRSLARGESKVVHVDLTGESLAVRQAFDVVAYAFAQQREISRRQEAAIKRHEALIRQVSAQGTHTEAEVNAMQQRLDEFEARLKEARALASGEAEG